MSFNNSYYARPQEDDLFSLTFTQPQSIPMLSHSQSSFEDSPLSSYQDSLLLNLDIIPTEQQEQEQPIQINNSSDDLIFELDNEFISTIKQKPTQKINQNNNNILNTKNLQDNFANVAQQNYRLWLSSV